MTDAVRAVSFDVDGTLYEMPSLVRAIRRLVLRRWTQPFRTWRELRALGRSRREMDRVRRAGGDLSELRLAHSRADLLELEARWYVEGIRLAGLRPGVADALDDLSRRGVPLVAITDHPVQGKLAALGLEAAFQHVVVGEDLGHLKPSPVPFLAAVESLGIEPSSLLHVGDRDDTDGAGARRAGCPCHIVSPRGALAPDLFAELP